MDIMKRVGYETGNKWCTFFARGYINKFTHRNGAWTGKAWWEKGRRCVVALARWSFAGSGVGRGEGFLMLINISISAT